MKRSKFTESQIMFALELNESGLKAEEVCRKMGVSEEPPFTTGRRNTVA